MAGRDIRNAACCVEQGMERTAPQDPDNPYQHYRSVKQALQRATLDFAAAVSAGASSRVQERMARRVSRLLAEEDEAFEAMRRQDRSWSGHGLLGMFQPSDGATG